MEELWKKNPLGVIGGVLAVLAITFAMGKMSSISSCPPASPVSGTMEGAGKTSTVPPQMLKAQNWQLKPDGSFLAFTSIKKGKVGEAHTFKELRGEIKKDGTARIEIPLSSLETRIPIRNKRMKKLLFEVADFPLAVISAKLDMEKYKKLKPGQRIREGISFELLLHNVKKEMKADVFIDVLAGNRVSVTTLRPVILQAQAFNLESGMAALQSVAKLPSIARAVPVTFSLLFEGEGA